MVSLMKGLSVQQSRYAVLSLSQDSESEEDSSAWQVAQPKAKGANKKSIGTASTAQSPTEDGKVMSKSAKKRARKKRNKSTSSDQTVSVCTNIRTSTFLCRASEASSLCLFCRAKA